MLEVPMTLGKAVKQFISKRREAFMLSEVEEAMSAYHPDLMAEGANVRIYQNMCYWTSKAYLEKLGQGSLARFKVLVPEFFNKTDE